MTFARKGERIIRPAPADIPLTRTRSDRRQRQSSISLLKPGAKADIHVDAYPTVFEARVFRIRQLRASCLLDQSQQYQDCQRLPLRLLLARRSALRPMMVEVSIAIRTTGLLARFGPRSAGSPPAR
jgi:hypothetical protein